MKKYYELGRYTASIEKTSSGYYIVTVKEDGIEYEKWMLSDKAKALEEILSFAEMDEDDWEEEK